MTLYYCNGSTVTEISNQDSSGPLWDVTSIAVVGTPSRAVATSIGYIYSQLVSLQVPNLTLLGVADVVDLPFFYTTGLTDPNKDIGSSFGLYNGGDFLQYIQPLYADLNPAYIPATGGYVVIDRGYLVDFAQDLSQPAVIQNYDVNKTMFSYSDNDDKRKLYTKIVAKGKDLQGVTISVAVSAVHTYDNSTQYFEDATHVTLKSEGYIYKNNYIPQSLWNPVTVYVAKTVSFSTNYGSSHYNILIGSDCTQFPLNGTVWFNHGSGTLPSGLSEGTKYWIVSKSTCTIQVSTTRGGGAIDIGSGATAGVLIISYGGFVVDTTYISLGLKTQVIFNGTAAPGNVTFGTTYYCGTDSYVSSGFFFNIYSDALLSSIVGVGASAGTSVTVALVSSIQNADSVGTTPAVFLYGTGYTIPSGSTMAFSIPNVSSTQITTNGSTSTGTDSNGQAYTKVPVASFPLSDFSGKGYFLNQKIYVDSNSVGTNQVLVGEELLTPTSVSTDSTYGDYLVTNLATRITSATLKCYPHGVGALVARTNYTEASPQTGSGVELYGLYIDNATVDSGITYGDLDTYATKLLLGLGNFYRKANCWTLQIYGTVIGVGGHYGDVYQTTLLRPIRVGDRISITQYDAETPIEYQVLEVDYNYDQGTITLQLGDYEKNPFTDIITSTSAINKTLT